MPKKLAHTSGQVDTEKSRRKDDITNKYLRELKSVARTQGTVKVYKPLKDAPETQLPPENTTVQIKIRDVLDDLVKQEAALLDLVMEQDRGNQSAKADVVVDGEVLLKDVPITSLLYWRTRLLEQLTVFKAIPTPDPAHNWEWDEQQGLLRTKDLIVTQRTAKVPFAFEKSKATDKFPAQVDTLSRDEVIGTFERRDYFGGEPADRKNAVVARAQKVYDAVLAAISTANIETEVNPQKVSGKVFEYIMQPITSAYAK